VKEAPKKVTKSVAKEKTTTTKVVKTEKSSKSQEKVQQVSTEKKTQAKIHARYYTVQSGDSLASIARAFLTTETKLKEANQLSSNLVYEGQKIKIQ